MAWISSIKLYPLCQHLLKPLSYFFFFFFLPLWPDIHAFVYCQTINSFSCSTIESNTINCMCMHPAYFLSVSIFHLINLFSFLVVYYLYSYSTSCVQNCYCLRMEFDMRMTLKAKISAETVSQSFCRDGVSSTSPREADH